jgi:hypothetical protein
LLQPWRLIVALLPIVYRFLGRPKIGLVYGQEHPFLHAEMSPASDGVGSLSRGANVRGPTENPSVIQKRLDW